MKARYLVAIVTFFCLVGCVGPMSSTDQRLTDLEQLTDALQQKSVDLEAKLSEIDARLSDVEKDGGENGRQLRNQMAGLYATLENLNDQVQLLQGRIEETSYELEQKEKAIEEFEKKSNQKIQRIETISNLTKDRIVRVEEYLGFNPSDELDLPISTADLEQKSLSADEIYNVAKQAFDRNDFETARQGFQKILKEFPDAENADNAQFWIGEIYYREKWYEKSILEYQKVIEKYPKGNKVPASLLKQGLAFSNLRDKANARLILEELLKKYPDSNEASIAKKKLEEL